MSIRKTWFANARVLGVSAAVFALAACGDSNDSGADDASTTDGAVGASPDAGLDSGPNARDAAVADATEPAADTQTPVDGADAHADAGHAVSAGIGIGGLYAHICTASSYAAPLSSAGANPQATQLGDRAFGFVEGPVWVEAENALFFSDMDFASTASLGPLSQIWRMDVMGHATSFVASSGSNGLALGPSGKLLAATHDTQSLSLYDLASGARTNLSVLRDGKHFNSPNDLVVRSDGTVYFTDPDWQLGDRTSELGVTGAYRVGPPLAGSGTATAHSFEDALDKPNGIALSPDEQTLYLGSNGTEIWAYDVAADGTPSNRRMFANPGGSDGMTVDCAGNVYIVSSGAVQVYAADGTKLGEIAVAENPTNVAFGGADHRTLFITAQTHVYTMALALPGLPY